MEMCSGWQAMARVTVIVSFRRLYGLLGVGKGGKFGVKIRYVGYYREN
jgi:hypothetical protein